MNVSERQEYNSMVDDVAQMGYTILNYKEAARAQNRGIQRLHRKIDARDEEIERLREFIDARQLTGELDAEEEHNRMVRRMAYLDAQFEN